MAPPFAGPDALWLDLELDAQGQLRQLGAVRGGRVLRSRSWAELADFAAGATVLGGHNALAHDRPHLARLVPDHPVLALPVVDSLVFSALAFPLRPYHALVKGHKLVRAELDDPVADARLARRVWAESAEQLGVVLGENAHLCAVLGHCLRGWEAPGSAGTGHALAALGASDPGPVAAAQALLACLEGEACEVALAALGVDLLGAGLTDDPSGVRGPALAFAVRWIQASPDGGGVLPAWVRRAFPAVVGLLDRLRGRPCDSQAPCSVCAARHSATAILRTTTPYRDFRPQPAWQGRSLQEAVTAAALEGQDLVGVLPTGGGKSLCYQLPAVARHHNRGQLTVVVSPLQALMKDQVEGFARLTGLELAVRVHGGLTMPERREALRRVEDGRAGLVYLSPEQLRSPAVRRCLTSRELGAWVLDEAHCLSQWGHDFRTDYLHVPRFIAETAQRQGLPPPPVQCFTATAQRAVIAQLQEVFAEVLGPERPLAVFDGGVHRANLEFAVRRVPPPQRLGAVVEELAPLARAGGAGVVFCGSRKGTERLAQQLGEAGWRVVAFHAGLDPEERQRRQEQFMGGAAQVVVATSAFGMGVDKPDVRVVVHADMPGSLESYLQQAGRAGRDGAPARCVLLYDPGEVEQIFYRNTDGQLTPVDLKRLLGSLRALGRSRRATDTPAGPRLRLTTGELMRQVPSPRWEPQDRQGPNRVAAALSWLERAELVRRDENLTAVFQGRPVLPTLQAAEQRVGELGLKPLDQRVWRELLRVFYSRGREDGPEGGMTADDLAELAGLVPETRHLGAGRRLLRTLQDMVQAGLLSEGLEVGLRVRHKVKDPSDQRLARLVALDEALLALLEEQAPEPEGWVPLRPATVAGELSQRLERPVTAVEVAKALAGLEADRPEGAAGWIQVRPVGHSRRFVQLEVGWQELRHRLRLRHGVAAVTLRRLLATVPADTPPSASLDLDLPLARMEAWLREDVALMSVLDADLLPLMQRVLLFLHDGEVALLRSGRAIFRQVMTLTLPAARSRHRWTQAHHAQLAEHQGQRVLQARVMDRYAEVGCADVDRALELARDWFALPRDAFLGRWLAEERDRGELALPTTAERRARLLDGLDPDQRAVVTAPTDRSMLVLAGPGAGKTRVIVRRVAWLLHVEQVRPQVVAVLCYNRATVLELRRRLAEVAGPRARGVRVQTLHGLALGIVGLSREGEPDFAGMLRAATAALEGGEEPGEDRLALLGGLEHILVDEYQDVDGDQYALLGAVAARSTAAGPGRTDAAPVLLAVGDDDQNIYEFRGSSTAYLRRFVDDYDAEQCVLGTNHRSTGAVLAACQHLIAHDPGRAKAGIALRLPEARRELPPGGRLHGWDPELRGRVQRLHVADGPAQAAAVVAEARRLLGCEPGERDWSRVAVLARTWAGLHGVRAALAAADIPHRVPLPPEAQVRPERLRVVWSVLESLEAEGDRPQPPATLRALAESCLDEGPWAAVLREELAEWAARAGDGLSSARELAAGLRGALAQHRGAAAVGTGVFLGTLHGVKGLEFPHVFVLDGDWGRPRAGERAAERRLLYVGMSRAQESLCLVRRADRPHVLHGELDGAVVERQGAVGDVGDDVQYGVLGLKSLFLDWAGRQPAGAPCHRALGALRALQPVELRRHSSGGVGIFDRSGVELARLSREAAGRVELPVRARVLQVVRREAKDARPEYRDPLRCAAWWVPVVETRRP